MSLASWSYGNKTAHEALQNIALEVSNDFTEHIAIRTGEEVIV